VPFSVFTHHKERDMALLRVALAGCLLLAVGGVGLAQKGKGKVDKAKLIGTWTFVKTTAKRAPPEGAVLKLEFTKGGKMNVTFTVKDKTEKGSGTWTLKGDQLTTAMKSPDGEERKETVTITELTDKKLVAVGKEGGKSVTTEFKR
jgi:uncharacterized protein (TIGR03066 family)